MTTSDSPKAEGLTPEPAGAAGQWPTIDQISAWANEFFRSAPGSAEPTLAAPVADVPSPPTAAADPTLTGLDLGRAGLFTSAPTASPQPSVPGSAPYYPNIPQPSTPNVLPVFPNLSQPPAAANPLPFSTGLAQPAIPQLPPFYPAVPQQSVPYVAPIAPALSQPSSLSSGMPFASGLAQPALPGIPPFSPALPQPSSPMAPPVFPNVSQPSAAAIPQTDTEFASFGQPAFPNSPAAQGVPQPSAAGMPGFVYPDAPAPGLYFLSGEHVAPSSTPNDAWLDSDPFLTPFETFSDDARIEAPRDGKRTGQAHQAYDVAAIRADFPILQQRVEGRPLVWLDNAATTQKPNAVIERISQFYLRENSNIHRAAHTLAARATDAYEAARQSARRFLNASSAEEIVFVRGTTEGINLLAQTWGKRYVEAGDEIIISHIEHHSNIVPWQMLCAQTGAKLKVAPVDDTGQILLEEYERLFTSRTKLVSFTQVSNALGTVLPVDTMVQIAHRHGARAIVDGAQAVCHMSIDVQSMDCDFYVFSGHKVFGPTGIGVVYGKKALLEAMPPYQGGGNMIGDVTFEKTVYQPPPMRFEAGTGNIADAVGLGAALDYLQAIGVENVNRHEHELLEYGTARLLEIPRLRLIGTAKEKAAVMGFVLDDVPTEQVGAALASEGIAVRAGHHCAQPALRRFGVESTVRPSLALYNDKSDIDALVGALKRLQSRWLR